MKVTFIKNGSISLALSPETESEKILLAELFTTPTGIVCNMHEKLQILDKSIPDSVVITSKIKEDGK